MTKPHITHAFESSSFVDNVKREIYVLKLSDGTISFKMITKSGNRPNIETTFSLSPAAFNILSETMFTAAHNIEQFAVKEEWPLLEDLSAAKDIN